MSTKDIIPRDPVTGEVELDYAEALRGEAEDVEEGRFLDWLSAAMWVIGALVLIAIALIFIILGSKAHAAEVCMPHAVMLNGLKEQFKEEVVAGGVTQSGLLLELTAALSGSWSVIITNSKDDLACIKASGQGFGTSLKRRLGQSL